MRPILTESDLILKKSPLTTNEQLLVQLTIAGVNERYKELTEETIPQTTLIERIIYELNIIIGMGFADYMLIVGDFLRIGEMIGHMPLERIEYLRAHMYEMTLDEMVAYIEADQSQPGMTVGLGRGSAAGSVVAYANHITNMEPITNGLLFERFLNPERVSMPDVDSDLANAKVIYGVRDLVIEYVSKKYGKDAVCSIVTKSTLKAKAAVDEVARVMMSRKAQQMGISVDDDNLKDRFYGLAREIKALIPDDDPDITFKSAIADDNETTVGDYIRQNFAENPEAIQILDYAIQLEGVNINYGKHAAGVVIADNQDVGEYGALMWQEDDTYKGWKFQMDGPDVEGTAGLLKMDFLGLTTLNTITAALRYIYATTGKFIDPNLIPEDPNVYREIFTKGNTFGVFQMEAPGARRILKQLEPNCLADLTLANALNRPGALAFAPAITARKHGQKTDETPFDRVPCLAPVLAETYGYPVYQEQVMQMVQVAGGFSLGQADETRRAMGKKKKYIIEEHRELFVNGGELENHDTHVKTPVCGAVSKGIPAEDAYAVYDGIMDFAKYGFNKSHAAVYARTAYITAWLKYHYPVQFFTAYINTVEKDKDNFIEILNDARKNGVKILPPDINDSQGLFTCTHDAIRFGFNRLGLKAKVQSETHDYASMGDFILRTSLTAKAIESLIDAGAFDRFSSSRTALHMVMPMYADYKADYAKAFKKMQQYRELQTDMEAGTVGDKAKYGMKQRKSLPNENQVRTTIETCLGDIANAENLIKSQIIPVAQYPDNPLARLQAERVVLGAYISGHPLDVYGDPIKYGCQPLGSPVQGRCSIMGMVSDLKIRAKKAEPEKNMAFFTLEDTTGSIPVCMFTEAYAKFCDRVENNAVLKLQGYIKADTRSNDGSLQFVVDHKVADGVTTLEVVPYDVRATIAGIEEMQMLQNQLSVYADPKGHPVYVFDQTTGGLYKLRMCVNDQAITNNLVVKRP